MDALWMGCPQAREWPRRALSDGAASAGTKWTASLALAAAALLTLPVTAGASDDPLQAPRCVRARAELDAALAAPDAVHSARLEHARRAARHECLGTDSGERQRSGAPFPAQVVPPTVAAEPRAHAPAPLTPPPPPLKVPRPTVITTCDAAGCWDSEGRRLNQMGPMLVGPRGVCTQVGGVVSCP